MARAGSCLHADQGRRREWTSVHDRVMTQGGGQTDPAPELMGAGLPCRGRHAAARGLTCRPGRRCATRHHLTATARQRGLCGDIEQALVPCNALRRCRGSTPVGGQCRSCPRHECCEALMLKMIGFDGDDTLWRSEDYYRDANAEFAA